MHNEDLIAINEEIAGMARAGLPLDQGLAVLAKEMARGKLQRVTAALARDLQSGRSLPEALQRQRDQIPPFYAGLVSAGIRTGRISDVLATLTVYARTIANVRTIVVDALFYPAIVLLFTGALIGFYSYYVLPQFDEIFKSFNMKLPWLTELAIQFSRHPTTYLVIPLAVIFGGPILLWFFLRFTESGRRTWARLVYAVPVVGTLIRSARLAAFTDLLAILVDHDIPLPEGFRLAGESSSDPLVADASQHICFDLSQGRPLAESLRGRGLVPEWVAWMVGLGERHGTLGKSLHQVAEMYRRQVELRAALLRTVLPPFVVVITATVVAILFFATMLPLVKLIEGLSK